MLNIQKVKVKKSLRFTALFLAVLMYIALMFTTVSHNYTNDETKEVMKAGNIRLANIDDYSLDTAAKQMNFGSFTINNANEIYNVRYLTGEEADAAIEEFHRKQAEKAAEEEATRKAAEEEAARQAAAAKAAEEAASVGTFRDGMYGRWSIPSVGINVGVYLDYGYDDDYRQTFIDAKDSALLYEFYSGFYLLADHCHQGFSTLYGVSVGTIATMYYPDGSSQNWVCTNCFWGHNTTYDLTDGNFVPVSNPGGIVTYTCASYTDSYNDWICYWQPC